MRPAQRESHLCHSGCAQDCLQERLLGAQKLCLLLLRLLSTVWSLLDIGSGRGVLVVAAFLHLVMQLIASRSGSVRQRPYPPSGSTGAQLCCHHMHWLF